MLSSLFRSQWLRGDTEKEWKAYMQKEHYGSMPGPLGHKFFTLRGYYREVCQERIEDCSCMVTISFSYLSETV